MNSKIILNKYFILLIINLSVIFSQAQAFVPGDILINANYGGPQVTPAILKTALKVYYKSITNANSTYVFSVKNSGVLNAKLEYAIYDNLGLGFASSYWNMAVDMQNNYIDNNPTNGISESYVDTYKLNISALAIGIRGNYHLLDETDTKWIDPYFGITLGITKYNYNLDFSSTYPDKKSVEAYDFFKSGYASRFLKPNYSSYVSTTFGVRLYPIKYFGFNFEAGWDRGAFLFGGVVFKFHTKPIKTFQD